MRWEKVLSIFTIEQLVWSVSSVVKLCLWPIIKIEIFWSLRGAVWCKEKVNGHKFLYEFRALQIYVPNSLITKLKEKTANCFFLTGSYNFSLLSNLSILHHQQEDDAYISMAKSVRNSVILKYTIRNGKYIQIVCFTNWLTSECVVCFSRLLLRIGQELNVSFTLQQLPYPFHAIY